MTPPLQILYEDNHLLALVKPPGIPTMGVAAEQMSVLTLARQYIKHRYRKPGNVYLGVVSRLDEPVTGVLLFARTSKAAARLSEQFRSRSVEKTYWAITEGKLAAAGKWIDFVAKDERARRMRVVAADAPGAQEARLEFRPLQRLAASTLVEVQLDTGRKHQIRVQFAARGAPILGDRRYGAATNFPAGIALLARRLAFDHPISHARIELTADVPPGWRQFGVRDGT